MSKERIFIFVKCAGILIFLAFSLNACVSMDARTLSPRDEERLEIIGSVATDFSSTQILHIIGKDKIEKKAYQKLKKEAQQKYTGNVDIANMTMTGSFSGWNILWGLAYFISPVLLNVQKITATADVVQPKSSTGETARINQPPGSSTIDQQKLGVAIMSISQTLIEKLPRNATIAVLSITSPSRNDSEYIIDEVEYHLVNSAKFKIVDRRRLDQIRSEQNFQISGDVDDSSAVSIGNMMGASIVLTGNVSVGTNAQLSIKAIDVKTGQIVSMGREQL